jgi:hypothetical protein
MESPAVPIEKPVKDAAVGTAGDESTDVLTVQGIAGGTAIPVTIEGGDVGGGTEYTEGDTDATITGQAILWEDAGNTLTPVSASKPLPVVQTGALPAGTNAIGKLAANDGVDIGDVTLTASENHIGEVGGRTRTISGSVTRPSDTNAYASGDAVTDSTSAPSVLTFSNAARVATGSGLIVGAELVDSANQVTKGDFDLFLFDTTYTPDNDNSAFTPTDTELETCIGVISFTGTNAKVGDATSGAGGNCVIPASLSNAIPFSLPSGTSLFGALVARSAYTPVSAEKLTVRLAIRQD